MCCHSILPLYWYDDRWPFTTFTRKKNMTELDHINIFTNYIIVCVIYFYHHCTIWIFHLNYMIFTIELMLSRIHISYNMIQLNIHEHASFPLLLANCKFGHFPSNILDFQLCLQLLSHVCLISTSELRLLWSCVVCLFLLSWKSWKWTVGLQRELYS